MGKHRHTKDREFISATEWKNEYGGKRVTVGSQDSVHILPFDHCALSLAPFQTPVCTPEGVLFDILNLIPYVKEHGKNPVTGNPLHVKDIIRLKMQKNSENQWFCPVTYKLFTNNSHVVAIKSTGNVFLFEAVHDLNIKVKNYVDLLTNEPFKKEDIVTLQDPHNVDLIASRDINNFIHLKQLRELAQIRKSNEGGVKHTNQTAVTMKQLEQRLVSDHSLLDTHDKLLQQHQHQQSLLLLSEAMDDDPARRESLVVSYYKIRDEYIGDVKDIMVLLPLVEDVNPGMCVYTFIGYVIVNCILRRCTTDNTAC